MGKPVKLSELVQAMELESPEMEMVTRVDKQNGDVVTIEKDVLRAVEADDQEALQGLEKLQVEIAQAILDDFHTRFLTPPSKFDFHEYRHMERFIRTLEDPNAAEQLWRAIKGKGAFRYFKDTAARLGLLDQWFRYRDEAMKRFAIEWAEAKGVAYEDDIRPRKSRQP